MPDTHKSHCAGCPYAGANHLPLEQRQRRTTPLSMEDNRGPVLLVFQAPGIHEWENGRPISSTKAGSAGVRILNALPAGKSRQSYNITNTVQCFPGKPQAQAGKRTRDKPPLAMASKHCSNWLRNDIEAYPYERIVVFGSHAHKTVRALGYGSDPRFCFPKHPTGGISNEALRKALA